MTVTDDPITSHDAGSNDAKDHVEQVKLLFDYTKFHIGLYTTLASILVATVGSTFAKNWQLRKEIIAAAVVCIAIAGLCGGVVASSLPYLMRRLPPKAPRLYDQIIGPLSSTDVRKNGRPSRIAWLSGPLRIWTYLEHSFFWAAVILVLVAFAPLVCRTEEQQTETTSVEVKGYDNVKVTR